MVHQKDLKSPKDLPRWMRAATGAPPPPAAPSPPAPPTGWPWWAHMDPAYPEALLAFLEMRLRRKYLQDRRPQPQLISDGTQTDDAHHSKPLESPNRLTSEPSTAHNSKPLESSNRLTSEPSNAHNSKPLESPNRLTSEPSNTHNSKPLESSNRLTSEPSNAHNSKPLESSNHLTSEPSNAHNSKPLESPNRLTSEPSNTHNLKQLESSNRLTSEPSNAHNSKPLESPNRLTSEPSNTHNSKPLESSNRLTSEPSNAHNSKPLESPKRLTSEPSNRHNSKPLESPNRLTSEPSNAYNSRHLKGLKQLNEPSDTHSFTPLESPKQLTNEPSDPHSLRTPESPKHLACESFNTLSSWKLKSPKLLTSEPSDAHTSTPHGIRKHLTSEPSNTQHSRLLESPKHLASETADTQNSRQLKSPKRITSDPTNGHTFCPLQNPKHRTSERSQSSTLGMHCSHLTTEMSDTQHDVRHWLSYSQKRTFSSRRTSICSHSSQKCHSTTNQQALIQTSVASIAIGGQWQESQRTPFVSPRMDAAQSNICTLSSHFSTTRTFSMRGGEWYVEQESTAKVNPDSEANKNDPSTDHNIDRMLLSTALNPKPQSIFQKLFRFQSKSSVSSEASKKCSLPFDGQSTTRNDFKLSSSTCKIPTEEACNNDFFKVEKDVLIYTFKDADKGMFYRDLSRRRRHTESFSHRTPHARSKPHDELRCIYLNRAPSYGSVADDLFYESDSSSSEINLFFSTMNFGTAFSDSESSSESASSSYSPRRTKYREECIDLRNALALQSENETQHNERTEDVTRKQNGRLPVPRTRCQHSCVRPLPLNNEQHTSAGTATATKNYCGIHDNTRERFEIEFLKQAVIKLFDMNPEQLKSDSKNSAPLMESTEISTPSTSRRSPARSPRTPRNTNRKATQFGTKETNEGVFSRMWRNIVRLVQRKRTQDSGQPASSEQTVRASCATPSSGRSGTKASEVKDRDASQDGSFTPRVVTLDRIDEVPETTTSGSSALASGPSNTAMEPQFWVFCFGYYERRRRRCADGAAATG